MHKEGVKQASLAKLFGVSQGAISNVVNNETWKHIVSEESV